MIHIKLYKESKQYEYEIDMKTLLNFCAKMDGFVKFFSYFMDDLFLKRKVEFYCNQCGTMHTGVVNHVAYEIWDDVDDHSKFFWDRLQFQLNEWKDDEIWNHQTDVNYSVTIRSKLPERFTKILDYAKKDKTFQQFDL